MNKQRGTDATSHLSFQGFGEWLEYLEGNRSRMDARWTVDQALARLDEADLWDGYCGLCARSVRFAVASATQDGHSNLRESMVCPECRTNARIRAGLLLLAESTPSHAHVYMTEQVTPIFAFVKRRYPNAIGSEYFSDQEAERRLQAYLRDLGSEERVRREDVTALSFESGSLDAIVSFDVLEHVPDFRRALDEFARTLKSGGRLVLTAPFIASLGESVLRARLKPDGTVEHLLEPEYHGDPIAGDGILCFHHFCWDLLDHVRASGFATASMALPWSPAQGLAGSLWTLTATR